MGNYFTLLSLFRVTKEEHGLQAVGTANKNRMFIPLFFLTTKIAPNQNRPASGSVFGFSNTGTLVSYCSLTKCVTFFFQCWINIKTNDSTKKM